MKVKCQLCGTKFDLELNHNICPECAAYYRVEDTPRTYEESDTVDDVVDTNLEDDYDYSPDEDINENGESALEPVNKSAKKLSKGNKVIIVIQLLLLVFFIALPFIGKNKSNEKLENQRIKEEVKVVPVFSEEEIRVGDYKISIFDYYIDNEAYWNLPDNYVVYAVSYRTKYVGSSYTSLYSSVDVYLETSDGKTIAPLSSYNARECMTDDRYHVMERKLGDYIKIDGGILYFVLKEDEEIYGLGFDVYKCDEEDSMYKEIDKIYHMYLPELEVE